MATTPLDALTKGIDQAQQALNNNAIAGAQEQFRQDGFLLPSSFSADGNGLPYTKVNSNKSAQLKRNIITWFIPEFGTVRMYVNPNSISYQHKKNITKERTKGGFTLQYWGEDLTTINIGGTTGSSGIEGINVLYEMYRAEQYAFDAVGLTLAANTASADLSGNFSRGLGSVFGGSSLGNAAASGLTGVLGLDSTAGTLAARNIPSLAQLAFTVEFYYAGWVYRGFFESITINERADNFLMDYNIVFIATQKRGYRSNRFSWERSAKDGPSQYNTPNSFSGNIKSGI